MQATLADRLGLNGPQEKNNSDNTKILADYVRRYHEETKKDTKRSKREPGWAFFWKVPQGRFLWAGCRAGWPEWSTDGGNSSCRQYVLKFEVGTCKKIVFFAGWSSWWGFGWWSHVNPQGDRPQRPTITFNHYNHRELKTNAPSPSPSSSVSPSPSSLPSVSSRSDYHHNCLRTRLQTGKARMWTSSALPRIFATSWGVSMIMIVVMIVWWWWWWWWWW